MKRLSIVLGLLLAGTALWATSGPTPMPVPPVALVRSHDVAPLHPTFNHDVAPIIYQHCTECHRPGQIGPFALTSYAEIKRHGAQIGKATASGAMPPWKPQPGWGEFASDRHLSQAQIDTIQNWIRDGKPGGDATAPPRSDGWTLGPPDVQVAMTQPFTVPADGPDLYRCFVLPLPFATSTDVQAVEFRTDNRRVVHHALFFLDHSGQARRRQAQAGGQGYPSFGGPGFPPSGTLGGWVPGAMPQRLPDGVVQRVAGGSDLVMQMHFHPSGRPETVRCQVGLHLSHHAATTVVGSVLIGTPSIDIPAGVSNYTVRDRFILPVNLTVYAIAPHAHLLCHDVEAVATLPAGEVVPLIRIPHWDFNWQGQYAYRQPLRLPAGTRLDICYHYDNSANNPHNPSRPPRRVQFGERTTDEMALLFLTAAPDTPSAMVALKTAMRRHMVGNVLQHPYQWFRLRDLWQRRRAASDTQA